MGDRRSTVREGPTPRYVPSSGFGYPRDGLLPPSPGRPYFVPAALMGFALRSFLLTEGTRRVSARVHPHTVSPAGYPSRRSGRAGPAGRGFWALTLPRVPSRWQVVSSPTTGCSLGLRPSRASQPEPGRNFARLPPTRLANHRLTATNNPRHGVSISSSLVSRTPQTGWDTQLTALIGFSHQ
jgi:hypothetical protein